MLENSTYSVISPEGAASILWKDAKLSETSSRSNENYSSRFKRDGNY